MIYFSKNKGFGKMMAIKTVVPARKGAFGES